MDTDTYCYCVLSTMQLINSSKLKEEEEEDQLYVLLVVAGGTAGGAGVDEQPVGLRGRGHGGEPAVADGELGDELAVDGDAVGGEAVHDGVGHVAAQRARLLHEAVHPGGAGRGVGAEDLLPDLLERVPRVRATYCAPSPK